MIFTGVCLISSNVPALAAFYAALFGCPAQMDGSDHAELTLPGLHLAIFSRAGMERMAPGSMAAARPGSFTLGFHVDDVDSEAARLAALGVDLLLPPTTHPWGARSLWFRDLDGNIIDFWMEVLHG